jgi:hypothetical protein
MSEMKFDEDKEITLGEQIDILILAGNPEAEKWQAVRRILISRIPGLDIQQASTLTLSTVAKIIIPVADILKKAFDRQGIDLNKLTPKGEA